MLNLSIDDGGFWSHAASFRFGEYINFPQYTYYLLLSVIKHRRYYLILHVILITLWFYTVSPAHFNAMLPNWSVYILYLSSRDF